MFLLYEKHRKTSKTEKNLFFLFSKSTLCIYLFCLFLSVFQKRLSVPFSPGSQPLAHVPLNTLGYVAALCGLVKLLADDVFVEFDIAV